MIATSYCRFCHANCGIKVEIDGDRVVAVRGDRDHPISRGFMCEKGRQLPAQHHSASRIRGALKRESGRGLTPIASERAIDEIADRLEQIIATHGPRAVGLYNGTKSWANVSFGLALSWLDGIGSPSFYTTVTIDQPAKLMANALHGRWLGGYHRIGEADVTMFVGTNPVQSFLTENVRMPCPDALAYLREFVTKGLALIVIDPRRTESARLATVHLPIRPGQDAALLAGMIRLLIERDLYDREFVERHAKGLDELRGAIDSFTLDLVARRTDVPARDIEAAAELFGTGPRGAAVAGTGPNMAPHPLATEMLVAALNTLCGRYAREGDLASHGGVLGAPFQPRAEVAPPRQFWGHIAPPRVKGLRTLNWEQPTAALADEILSPGAGQIRALICNGGNPAVSFPDQRKVVQALEALELLVVLDVEPTPTCEFADYVLGCKLSLEKPDYTRHLEWYFAEPFAQYTPAIVQPICDVIEEWELFWGLANRMRVPLTLGRSPIGPPVEGRPVDIDRKPTTDELMEIEVADARIPLSVVKQHPGGAVFEEARLVVAPARPERMHRLDLAPSLFVDDVALVVQEGQADGAIEGVGSFPFLLTSRRMRQVFNSTGVHIDSLRRRGPGNPAYMNPDDMAGIGAVDGDVVVIRSAHGSITGIARVDAAMRGGVVSMAHAWGTVPTAESDPVDPSGGGCTNRLISSDVEFEPLTGQCRQSAIPVSVEVDRCRSPHQHGSNSGATRGRAPTGSLG
jgi:anaerobic selenocysteine-containing dehydrogenase